MGREARCRCVWGADEGEVLALLESSELITRGAIRRRAPLTDLRDLAVTGDDLRFSVAGEPVALTLGAPVAARWLTAIFTSPPSLARKLGVSADVRVSVHGPMDSPELMAALRERSPASGTPDLIVARVDDAQELDAVLDAEAEPLARAVPLWLVYAKGPAATFGDGPVRALMRARGYMDTKSSAVSESLTATRYARRQES